MALELWADERGPLTRVALVENGQMVHLEVDHKACQPRFGAQFVGKVVRVTPSFSGAELDLGGGLTAFLNTKRNPQQAGDLLTVEWIAPPIGDKLALVRRLPEIEASGEPRLLKAGPDALERAMLFKPASARVATPMLQQRLQKLGLSSELHSGSPSLFELTDLESQIEALTARKVAFIGGRLVIEHTEAACIIDVNGAGNAAEVNRAALYEVARQIRLRNLGGIILIDLIGDRRNIGNAILDQFRIASRDDSCPVNIYGITQLGLIECTRERRGWELAQLLRAAE